MKVKKDGVRPNVAKRILFVTEAFGGGVFTYLTELSNQLVNDFDICIAYNLRDQTPRDFESFFDPRVHFIRVNSLTRSISPSKDLRAFKDLKRIAEDYKPDIIHVHSSKAGVLGRLAFTGHYKKLYYTPHGYSFLMQDSFALKRALYWIIEKAVALTHSTTISCSPGEQLASEKLTKRSVLIPNAINTAALDDIIIRSESERDKKKFSVFTIGRIDTQKNPELFNEVASLLPNMEFVWVGDGPLREKLSAPNIRITGWTTRGSALREAIDNDLFILTSEWEGLPLSLLEAMYIRKPVVVTNVIGNRDVVENSKNGFICETASEFVSAIQKVRSNPSLSIKITNQAHEDVLESYNIKLMAHRYSELYNS